MMIRLLERGNSARLVPAGMAKSSRKLRCGAAELTGREGRRSEDHSLKN